MDIDAHPQTIVELFPVSDNSATKFSVPLYQRNYSWSDENIKELLKDIDQEEMGYYIGNLLVKIGNDKNEKAVDIIDGQQRLTTLALTMIAIRDFFRKQEKQNDELELLQNLGINEKIDEEKMRWALKNYARNDNRKAKVLRVLGFKVDDKNRVDDENKVKDVEIFNDKVVTELVKLDGEVRAAYGITAEDSLVTINPLNESDMEAVGTKDDIDRQLKIGSHKESRLVLLEEDAEVYNSLLGSGNKIDNRKSVARRFKTIQKELNELCSSIEEYKQFYDKLSGLTILRIMMKDLSDAFNVFSSLNGKGTPLTLLDLLKSEYMRIFSEREKNRTDGKDSQKEALKRWNGLLDKFRLSKNDQVSSRAATQFLQNNYDTFMSKSLSSITKHDVLNVYREKFLASEGDYLKELSENAELFSVMIPSVKSTDIDLNSQLKAKIGDLQALEASQAYPLMLYLLSELRKKRVEESTVITAFDYLVNFYVRRNTAAKPKSSNVRAVIIKIVRALQNKSTDAVLKEMHELKKISVSDAEFESSIGDLSYDSDSKLIRYLLVGLERKNGHYFNKQNTDNLDDKDGKGNYVWTIEHILPQTENLGKEWCNMIASPEEIEEGKVPKIQADNMHRIGNLTLTGYNSEMGAKPFAAKRDYRNSDGEYSGYRTELYLNQLNQKGEGLADKQAWTPKDIQERTATLARQIVKDFPLAEDHK